MSDLLGSPWRRRSDGEMAIVTGCPAVEDCHFTEVRLGGINDDGTPNDQTWTVDDEAELRRDWEPVRRVWVAEQTDDDRSDIERIRADLRGLRGEDWSDGHHMANSDRAMSADLPMPRFLPPAPPPPDEREFRFNSYAYAYGLSARWPPALRFIGMDFGLGDRTVITRWRRRRARPPAPTLAQPPGAPPYTRSVWRAELRARGMGRR